MKEKYTKNISKSNREREVSIGTWDGVREKLTDRQETKNISVKKYKTMN